MANIAKSTNLFIIIFEENSIGYIDSKYLSFGIYDKQFEIGDVALQLSIYNYVDDNYYIPFMFTSYSHIFANFKKWKLENQCD